MRDFVDLLRRVVGVLLKEDTPWEDFKRNYSKYSKYYREYSRR